MAVIPVLADILREWDVSGDTCRRRGTSTGRGTSSGGYGGGSGEGAGYVRVGWLREDCWSTRPHPRVEVQWR